MILFLVIDDNDDDDDARPSLLVSEQGQRHQAVFPQIAAERGI